MAPEGSEQDVKDLEMIRDRLENMIFPPGAGIYKIAIHGPINVAVSGDPGIAQMVDIRYITIHRTDNGDWEID